MYPKTPRYTQHSPPPLSLSLFLQYYILASSESTFYTSISLFVLFYSPVLSVERVFIGCSKALAGSWEMHSHYPFFRFSADNQSLDPKMNNIKMGSVYEIDHIYLPPRTPVQLKSIRVAMV